MQTDWKKNIEMKAVKQQSCCALEIKNKLNESFSFP